MTGLKAESGRLEIEKNRAYKNCGCGVYSSDETQIRTRGNCGVSGRIDNPALDSAWRGKAGVIGSGACHYPV